MLKTRTTAEWLERLEAAGVPCAPVLTRDQVIAHPHVLAGDILLESDHPAAGRLRQTRTAARFETPTVIRQGAPRLGEHNGEILRELGLTEAEIGELGRHGAIGPRQRHRAARPGSAGRKMAPRAALQASAILVQRWSPQARCAGHLIERNVPHPSLIWE